MKFFSVVIPIFNCSDSVLSLGNTLVRQTFQDFEVVLVDDGSADLGAKEIHRWLGEANIASTLVRLPYNQGAARARNIGIQQAIGRWIAFLDSDDEWMPEKLAEVHRIIVESRDINCIIHWEKIVGISVSDGILRHGVPDNCNLVLPKELYRRNFMSTSAVVLEADFLSRFRFDEELKSCHDYELWLSMAPYLKIFTLRKVLGIYNFHKSTISRQRVIRRLKNEVSVLWKYKHYDHGVGVLIRFFTMLLSRRWLQ